MTDTSQIDEEYGLSEDERKQIERDQHLDNISEELSDPISQNAHIVQKYLH